MTLLHLLLPEIILIAVASVLFLLGLSNKAASRRLAPWLAIISLIAVFGWQIYSVSVQQSHTLYDAFGGRGADGEMHGTLRVAAFAQYIQLITAGIGILLVLLA